MRKRGNRELDIDPLFAQIAQMKLEGKPQEEIDEAYQNLEDKVNTSFDESVMEDAQMEASDEQTAEEMLEQSAQESDVGPSRRFLEEDQRTAQAEPVKQEGEEILTPIAGQEYKIEGDEDPLTFREFID